MTTTLIGVDFSGAQQDNATWIAMTTDGDDGQLQWETPFPIRRADLEQLLLTINGPAIAALDFPFGLPSDFAVTQGFVRWGEGLMDSCDRMAGADQAEFEEVAKQYVSINGEPRRASDVPTRLLPPPRDEPQHDPHDLPRHGDARPPPATRPRSIQNPAPPRQCLSADR